MSDIKIVYLLICITCLVVFIGVTLDYVKKIRDGYSSNIKMNLNHLIPIFIAIIGGLFACPSIFLEKPQSPEIFPKAQLSDREVKVYMDSPDGTWIYYTLDDTHLPNRDSKKYDQPFVITQSTTITAVAIDTFDCISESVSRIYTISEPGSWPERVQGWSRATGYDYIYFGRKKDHTPLLWRVLKKSPESTILLSERIQAAHKYDTRSSDWENSELNNWLNTEYLDITFNDAERSALIMLNDGYCITIPTKNDLKMNEYGFSNATTESNRTAAADTGDGNDLLYINRDNGCGAYYTKSKVNDQVMTIVTSTGKFMDGRITRVDIGVRPMIYINLDMLEYAGGDGTIEKPYEVSVK